MEDGEEEEVGSVFFCYTKKRGFKRWIDDLREGKKYIMVAGLETSGEKGKTFKKPLKQRMRGNRDHSRKKILLSDEGKMIEKEDEGLVSCPQPTMQEAQVTSENGRRKKRKISGPQGAPPPLSSSSVLYGGYTVI